MTSARRPSPTAPLVALGLALLLAAPVGARDTTDTRAADTADSVDRALARAVLLEQADELAAARRAAEKAVALGGGPTARLRAGWLAYRTGDTDGALAHYRAVREVAPTDEQALLGETLVLALREDWAALRTAATALAEAHPLQPWGWVRLGLAALQGGALEDARAAYERALELRPDMAEALLGLGFVARAEGDRDEAVRRCRAAAQGLPADDERVAACVAPPPTTLTVSPSAWGLVAGYTDYYTRDLVWSAAAETELRWSSGPGLHLGVAVSQTRMRFSDEDFTQVMPSAGVSFVGEDVAVSLGYLFAWQDGPEARSEHVVAAGVGWWAGAWGFGVDAAALAAPGDEAIVQAGLPLSWGRGDAPVRIVLTPAAQYWADGSDDQDGAFFASVALDLGFRPLDWLSLAVGGWYGRRRSFVEPGGRFVWNSDDVLQGGARLSVAFRVAAPVWLTLRLRDELGVEQAGRTFDFQLLTAQLGIVVEL